MSFEERVESKDGASEMNGVSGFAEELGDLKEAVSEFRLSVHAWSEAEMSRPRTVIQAASRRVWHLAFGWALGCVLVVGGLSGGVVYKHHLNELKIAQARALEHERLVAERRSQQARQEEEDLLAKVDSDVSREVPSAMEPLAQLMAEDEAK